MNVSHVKSTFPCSLGARITGVDDKTYSSTGEAFSTIVLPQSESNANKELQADDVSLGTRCLLVFDPLTVDCSPPPPLLCVHNCSQPMSSPRNSYVAAQLVCAPIACVLTLTVPPLTAGLHV